MSSSAICSSLGVCRIGAVEMTPRAKYPLRILRVRAAREVRLLGLALGKRRDELGKAEVQREEKDRSLAQLRSDRENEVRGLWRRLREGRLSSGDAEASRDYALVQDMDEETLEIELDCARRAMERARKVVQKTAL